MRSVFIGAGGHAQTIISIMTEEQKVGLAGYVDLMDKGDLWGSPYLGTDDYLSGKQGSHRIIIGFSYIGSKVNLMPRAVLIRHFAEEGFRFESVVSERAIIHPSVSIGEGTVIMPGVVINQGTVIGKNCVINTGAIIDHNCYLQDNVQISPGVIVCGGTSIHHNSFIGAGAIIRDSVVIGSDIIIGMGSNITKSVWNKGTYYTKKVFFSLPCYENLSSDNS